VNHVCTPSVPALEAQQRRRAYPEVGKADYSPASKTERLPGRDLVRTEAFGISLWDKAENAEAYNRGAYPEVTKILATVVEGPAQVETFEVSNSTFHKIAAAVTA
jgi:hypothetical protein